MNLFLGISWNGCNWLTPTALETYVTILLSVHLTNTIFWYSEFYSNHRFLVEFELRKVLPRIRFSCIDTLPYRFFRVSCFSKAMDAKKLWKYRWNFRSFNFHRMIFNYTVTLRLLENVNFFRNIFYHIIVNLFFSDIPLRFSSSESQSES